MERTERTGNKQGMVLKGRDEREDNHEEQNIKKRGHSFKNTRSNIQRWQGRLLRETKSKRTEMGKTQNNESKMKR